ncbi:hypothetical protein RHGRI_016095 [Rhododendron griersonianum]|uniref:ATP synthase mitochondrial F1 complex assembly factor 1 n=1 Tax=Rhododendron griersonianum TaxID=479676 RepID=A0AAV6JTE7_9ERIC|nr:hypothetical protein RHGRI_016095 [Rhododendron griersonianum]
MQQTTRVSSRRVLSSVATLLGNALCHCNVPRQSFTTYSLQELQKSRKHSVPGDLVTWGSLGFCRTSRFAAGFTPLQHKPLNSIIDLERTKDRPVEDLIAIWDDVISHNFALSLGKRSHWHFHESEIVSSAGAKSGKLVCHYLNLLLDKCFLLVRSCSNFSSSYSRYFVIPLWRGSGYTTMFAQVQMPHILFTGLEDYKARGTQAAPYFTVSYYTEFAEKDLVLIRGDVVFTSKISDSEAKWLLETMQSFYLNDNRYKLVERFNRETRDFEFKDVLKALDMPIL